MYVKFQYLNSKFQHFGEIPIKLNSKFLCLGFKFQSLNSKFQHYGEIPIKLNSKLQF